MPAMPLLQTRTTRQLLTWVNVATAGAALLLASGAFIAYDAFTIHGRCVRLLTAQAEMIAYNAAPALLSNDRHAAATTLKGLRAETQVLAAGIFKPDGVALVTYVRDDLSAAAALVNADEGDGHKLIGNRLLVYRTIDRDGEKIGSVRLLSAMEEITASVLRHLAIAAVIFIAAIGASLPVLSRLHRRISGPIMELVAKARIVSEQKDLSVRATESGQDEIGLLVRTFNEMLSRIQKSDQERDQELHQRLEQELEPLRHVPEIPEPRAERDQAPPTRATEVIEQNAGSPAHFIEVLLDVLESLRTTAELRGVRLQLIVDPRAIVIAVDAERLKQILRNFLSNAIEFTPEGGHVQVVAHRIDSHVGISVRDTGRGIDPAFLPHIFDQSHQADGTGIGLGGLPTVRHLVELYGGRVRADRPGEGQGATFTIELPIAGVHSPASERAHATAAAPGLKHSPR